MLWDFGCVDRRVEAYFFVVKNFIFEKKNNTMNLDQKEWWEGFLTTENAVILDVRTEEEVANGIIPEAINIDIYKEKGNYKGIIE